MIKKRTEKIIEINDNNFYLQNEVYIINYVSKKYQDGMNIDQSTAYKFASDKVKINSNIVTCKFNANGTLNNIWVGNIGIWNSEIKLLAKIIK